MIVKRCSIQRPSKPSVGGIHIVKNPFSVEEKAMIVTGGGTGIGASIAREFALRGASVLIASRKLEHLEPVRDAIRRDGGRCELEVMDVRDAQACERIVGSAVSHFGRLDVLINNHGANIACPSLDLSPNGWKAVVEINLSGVFFASRAAARQFIAQKNGGVIINLSSVAGTHASPNMAAYGASKAGVINLTQSHASEWGVHGVRVNCIVPGPIETEGAAERTWPTQSLRDAMVQSRSLQRFGVVEEIAYPCLFLASDASSYITGAALFVDGGAAMRYEL